MGIPTSDLAFPVDAEALARFRRQVLAGTVAPAYLVCGRSGVGRGRFVRAAAALLLCEGGRSGEACGACRACREVAAGAHPDLLRIVPPPEKRWIPAAAVRRTPHETEDERRAYPSRLEDFLSLSSVRGGARVVEIDPADALTEPAANALLKTLEEPPPRVALFLVVEREGAMLPTIRSRAQVLRLRPADADALARRLSEARGVPPARARLLARFAGGAPSAADRLSDPARWAEIAQAARVAERALAGPPLSAAAGMLSWAEAGAKGGLEGARARLRLSIELLLHAIEPGNALVEAEETAPLAAAAGPARRTDRRLREAALAAHRALAANVHLPLVVGPFCIALQGSRQEPPVAGSGEARMPSP